MKRITLTLTLSLLFLAVQAQKSDFKELELQDLTNQVTLLNKKKAIEAMLHVSASEKMKAQVEYARILYKADLYDQAEEIYFESIDEAGDAQDYLNFATILLSNGKPEMAKEVFELANAKDPVNRNLKTLWEQVFEQLNEANFSENRQIIYEGRTMYGSSSLGSNYLMHVNNSFKEVNMGCLHEIASEHEIRLNNSEEGFRNTITYMEGPDMVIFSQRDEAGKFSLYQAFRKNGAWKKIKRLPLPEKANFIFPFGLENELYFSSDLEGGEGGYDIYRMSFEDGDWSEPVNMGESVNTAKNELFPSFHNGNLYFVSNGLPSFGGYDNYFLDFINDRVEHIGNPFNTRANDYGLMNYTPGKSAYALTKNKDAFKLEFVEKEAFDTKIMRGIVLNNQNQPVPNARITVFENGNRDGFVFITDASGEFVFSLPTEYYDLRLDVIHEEYSVLAQDLQLAEGELDNQIELVLGKSKTKRSSEFSGIVISGSNNKQVTTAATEKPSKVKDIARTVEPSPAASTAGNFYVVIGSTNNLQSARNFAEQWKTSFPEVEIISYEKKNIYRVGISAGTDKSDAVKELQKVRSKVKNAWLLSPSVQ